MPCFDPFLAQPEMVRMLLTALNDEVFEIRELAMGILSRLATHNPAYVLPTLRKKLIELLNDLEYSTDSLVREQSAHQLGSLLGGGGVILILLSPPRLFSLSYSSSSPSFPALFSVQS
jgi:FKBP12-rapamycin complex-associated protein